MADTPDDALIEAIAARIRHDLKTRTFPPDPVTGLGGMGLTEFDLARAAYAAMVDHLGLEWRNSVKDMLAREPHPRRRLVSRWQESTSLAQERSDG